MLALTIMQPYAELILTGEKLIENRTWRPTYYGPLLIHAGKSKAMLDSYRPLPPRMDMGMIVGVCNLEISMSLYAIANLPADNPYAYLKDHRHVEGPWCWVLSDVKRFPKPIPYRGLQKLYDVPQHVVAAQLRLVGWI